MTAVGVICLFCRLIKTSGIRYTDKGFKLGIVHRNHRLFYVFLTVIIKL